MIEKYFSKNKIQCIKIDCEKSLCELKIIFRKQFYFTIHSFSISQPGNNFIGEVLMKMISG